MTELAEQIAASFKWNQLMDRITFLERERIYCGHGRDHIRETLRIADLLAQREECSDLIPLLECAVLLHDLGRVAEYENGTPHEIASAELAEEFLSGSGFTEREIRMVRHAILGHRSGSAAEANSAAGADPQSVPADPAAWADPQSVPTDPAAEADSIPQTREAQALADLLKRADHLSRQCWSCGAADTCKWPEEKKNRSPFF